MDDPAPRNHDTNPKKSPVFSLASRTGMLNIIFLIIFLVFLSIFIVLLFSPPPPVAPDACGEKVLGYINANIVSPGTNASFLSVSDYQGIYRIRTEYQSQEIDTFATKDCSMLFTSGINMSASGNTLTQDTKLVQTGRPVVELYVMAFCPYGTQAETDLNPVADLLGNTTDIRIRYIVTTDNVSGTVHSFHGDPEAREDLRQTCIQHYYPSLFQAYLADFNDQCYPRWENSTFLAGCSNATGIRLGFNMTGIQACAAGKEGLALLADDENRADQIGAYSSPTMIINGIQYTGSRSPEAYKEAICNSYSSAPPACNTTLPDRETAGPSTQC